MAKEKKTGSFEERVFPKSGVMQANDININLSTYLKIVFNIKLPVQMQSKSFWVQFPGRARSAFGCFHQIFFLVAIPNSGLEPG